MARAFVGLGANLGDPSAQLREALRQLSRWPDVLLKAQSSFYRSAPLGTPDQPDYFNAVAEIETVLSAPDFLKVLLEIERRMGRERSGQRWQARTIDLDLLLYGSERIQQPGLRVPHPEMHLRNFVLAPLAEIAPGLNIPDHGPVRVLAERLPPVAIVARHD